MVIWPSREQAQVVVCTDSFRSDDCIASTSNTILVDGARGGSTRPPGFCAPTSEGDAHPIHRALPAELRGPRGCRHRARTPLLFQPKSPASELPCSSGECVRASELGNEPLPRPDGLERHDHESFSSSGTSVWEALLGCFTWWNFRNVHACVLRSRVFLKQSVDTTSGQVCGWNMFFLFNSNNRTRGAICLTLI